MPKRLSKADFMASKLKQEKLELPELNGEVWVREFTAAERVRVQELTTLVGPGGKAIIRFDKRFYGEIVAMVLVDEDGKQVFEPDDAKDLDNLGGALLDKITAFAMDLSGLGDDMGVKAAEKN